MSRIKAILARSVSEVHFPRLRFGLVWLVAIGPFIPSAQAQDAANPVKKVILPGEVRQVAARLAAAAELVQRSQWADALDEYQRLISEAGDDLVPQPEDGISGCQRSIHVRRLCHLRLAALPPAALRMYRNRVEVQADKWVRQGSADHDVRMLRRVVDEAFCSRAAAQALDVLGDLAFEQGDFEEALSWWRLLTPPADAPTDRRVQELVCPDPGVDLVRIQAKQILARLYQGDSAGAEQQLQAFRAIYPRAAGALGGRKDNYASTVQMLLDQARRGPDAESPAWPTFGGAATRSRRLAAVPSRRLWAEGPAWRVRLDSGELIKPASIAPSSSGKLPSFHPVIAGDKVFVADAHRVLAFQLLTGQSLWRYEMKKSKQVSEAESLTGRGQDRCARYSLTVAENRLYACLGTALLGPGKEGSRPFAGSSALVCLDVAGESHQSHGPEGRECWRIEARTLREVPTVFEGAPLVHRHRVFVAFTGLVGGRAQTAVACYDAATGALRWRQDVCETSEYEDQPTPRRRQNLLTLAGTQLVYCSHTGAIVALDSLTGKRTWAVRYPGRVAGTGVFGSPGRSGLDPTSASCGKPCIYDRGQLFAAPADSDRVFCLDPQTGRMLWERDGMEVVQLLGPAQGKLIFTTATGIRALNAATGGDQGGWSQPDVGTLTGSGRGLLAGGWVFWPTQDPLLPLRALSQCDGTQQYGEGSLDPTELRHLIPGNFAAGSGCLVIAGVNELAGYVPPERLPGFHRLDPARFQGLDNPRSQPARSGGT